LGKRNISVSEATFNRLMEHLKKRYGEARGHFQPFTEEAILALIHKQNPSDALTKAYLDGLKFDKLRDIQDKVRKITSFINFYGSYSDKNRAEMKMAIGDMSEEDERLVDSVFDAGKEVAKMARPILKEMLEALADFRKEFRLQEAREQVRRQADRK
jgi:polysaccharide deacetylase 2 family uncharacterized protein YibQ